MRSNILHLIDCVALIANFKQFNIFFEFFNKNRAELFYSTLNYLSKEILTRHQNILHYISIRNIYSVTNGKGQTWKEKDTILMIKYICHEIAAKFGKESLISALNASSFDNVCIYSPSV